MPSAEFEEPYRSVAIRTEVPVEEVVKVLSRVRLMTPEQRRLDSGPILGDFVARPASQFLKLHGYTAEEAAAIMGIHLGRVQRFWVASQSPQQRSIELVALAKEGRSVADLARETGLARTRIYKILKTARVDTTPYGNNAPSRPDQRREAARLWKLGLTYKEIGRVTGLSYNAIVYGLRSLYKKGELPEWGESERYRGQLK